jgi:hypothetical protein
MPGADGGDEGASLGADGQPEGSVLDIGSGEDRPVLGNQG